MSAHARRSRASVAARARMPTDAPNRMEMLSQLPDRSPIAGPPPMDTAAFAQWATRPATTMAQ